MSDASTGGPFGVRMSPDLKQEAQKVAKNRRWSLNSFVVFAVEEQLKREGEQRRVCTRIEMTPPAGLEPGALRPLKFPAD